MAEVSEKTAKASKAFGALKEPANCKQLTSWPSLFAGLDYWTGILDWTTGLQFLYLEFNFYGSSFNEY